MASEKVSDMTALAAVDIAAGTDLFYVVDVSASGSRKATIDAVFTAAVGANYARTLNVDAALSGTPQNVEVGGVASALKIATDEILVFGLVSSTTLNVNDHLTVDALGNVGVASVVFGSNGDIITPPDTLSINLSGSGLVLLNLPTADPFVAGALWNDSGTIKMSAG